MRVGRGADFVANLRGIVGEASAFCRYHRRMPPQATVAALPLILTEGTPGSTIIICKIGIKSAHAEAYASAEPLGYFYIRSQSPDIGLRQVPEALQRSCRTPSYCCTMSRADSSLVSVEGRLIHCIELHIPAIENPLSPSIPMVVIPSGNTRLLIPVSDRALLPIVISRLGSLTDLILESVKMPYPRCSPGSRENQVR